MTFVIRAGGGSEEAEAAHHDHGADAVAREVALQGAGPETGPARKWDTASAAARPRRFRVLGLRRREVLGLAWDQVDLDDAESYVAEQLQWIRASLFAVRPKRRHPRHRCRFLTCA